MILSSAPPTLAPGGDLLLAVAAVLLYLFAALPLPQWARFAAAALLGAWALHLLLLLIDIGGLGQHAAAMRWGFGPVISMTVWLMIAVHTVESRFLPLPAVRAVLALMGLVAVLAALAFPGEAHVPTSRWAPLHFALGVGSYGLFAAAVLHASLLDRAERQMRAGAMAARAAARAEPGQTLGLPLLRLERLTFRFVEVGFVVLTATLAMGWLVSSQWRWGDHKAVFSLLAWGVFAGLIAGRHLRGWRGRQATRWLYVGAGLLLLAYAGSRFVFEVMLGRAAH